MDYSITRTKILFASYYDLLDCWNRLAFSRNGKTRLHFICIVYENQFLSLFFLLYYSP